MEIENSNTTIQEETMTRTTSQETPCAMGAEFAQGMAKDGKPVWSSVGRVFSDSVVPVVANYMGSPYGKTVEVFCAVGIESAKELMGCLAKAESMDCARLGETATVSTDGACTSVVSSTGRVTCFYVAKLAASVTLNMLEQEIPEHLRVAAGKPVPYGEDGEPMPLPGEGPVEIESEEIDCSANGDPVADDVEECE